MAVTRYKHTIALCVLGSLLCGQGFAADAPTETDFTDAKNDYKEVWDSAVDANMKRAALERDLEKYESRVAQVRSDLAVVAKERRDVRTQIAEKRRLMDAVSQQLAAVEESKKIYTSLSRQQRDEFVSFVRYVAAKQMEITDTGPVQGGALTRRILRGSLGDTIEQELSRQALVTARQHLLSELAVMAIESDKAQAKLKEVAAQLTAELEGLNGEYQTLAGKEEKGTAVLDQSWQAWQLTEDQLAHVREEAEEANSKVNEMQQSLLRIHNQLKEYRAKQLAKEMEETVAAQKKLETQKQQLTLQLSALKELDDVQLRAYNTATQQRNTDKKQYKRIEAVELQIANIQTSYDEKFAEGVPDERQEESRQMIFQIHALREMLDFLKDGFPQDAVEEYLKAKKAWEEASGRIPELDAQLEDISTQLTDVLQKTSRIASDIESNNLETDVFDGAHPLFSWPVVGPIAAGFHDAAYLKVFGVQHNAIDIAVPQSTPVYSVADGVVYAVKDGGATGYSYILIGHRNGFASLYGHVSKIYVKAGDIVGYGKVIGASGGEPGSHGAGHMTTGSHLHLEMMKDGKHFDPREVLPKR